MKLKFDNIKTLKAVECKSGVWLLVGAYYKIKDIYSNFSIIAQFNTLEECKIFSDLNLSNVKLHIISYQDWLNYYCLTDKDKKISYNPE